MTPKIPVLKIVAIVGPTASGKSDLALRLAKLAQGKPFKKIDIHGAEIISADSRQVYRHLDIGTGKVPRDENHKSQITNHKQISNSKSKIPNQDYYSSGIKHHLIDIVSPKKQFTADDFKKLGEKAIREITARGKVPIIVGGTGFYIDVLLDRMTVAQVPPNPKLRLRLNKLTAEKLFEKLHKLDPKRAKTIDRFNKRRLIRALEISCSQYKVMSLNLAYAKFRDIRSYKILWLGTNPDKEILTKRIKNRLDARLRPSFAKASEGKEGMIREVEKLHKNGVSWKRLDDLGLEYRWISRYLREVKSEKLKVKSFRKSEYYKNLLRDIIRYSKRQMTWFKRNKEIHWLALNGVEGLENQKETERLLFRFLDG